MKLTFNQTIDDVVDLSKHNLKSKRSLLIIGGFFLFIIGIFSIGESIESVGLVLIPVVLLFVFWLILLKLLRKKMILWFGNKDLMTGERIIEVLEDKIMVWTPLSEGSYRWEAIKELKQSNKNYFLFVSKRQAILISKSAFESESQQIEFEQLINSKISNFKK